MFYSVPVWSAEAMGIISRIKRKRLGLSRGSRHQTNHYKSSNLTAAILPTCRLMP